MRPPTPEPGNRPRPLGRVLGAAALLALGFSAACSSEPPPEPRESGPAPEYVETGDLPALVERGYLRILMPPVEAERLPRNGYAIGVELELAEQLAGHLGLAPVVIHIAERDALLRALEQGRGDLVLARLTETRERQERFAFSTPLQYVREMLVVPADDRALREVADLAGVGVAVRPSSSFHATLEALRGKVPDLEIVAAPERMDTEQILAAVAEGGFEATVADEDLLEAVLEYRDDLKAAFPLTGPRPVGWAMRRDSPELNAAVDHFVHEMALIGDLDEELFGDLPTIRERKVVRVLSRNNAATTFLYRGEQLGFEFELSRRFARQIKCRVQVIVPPRFEDLVPWLVAGRGDLIAASMTVTRERAEQVSFSRSYLTSPQTVVVRADEEGVDGPDDLAGRRITVRPSSPYHATLVALREDSGIDFTIDPAPETLETETLIAGVADGTYDMTVADGHILGIELTWRDDVRGAFELGPEAEIAWAVRPGDEDLLGAVNGYLRHHGPGSEFFNVLRNKYFTETRQVSRRLQERPEITGAISPYDGLFRKYGQEYGIDWRLLAAQAFQESRFDVSARSWAGALGLMQLMPRTARGLGVRGDLRDADTGIRAGAMYLRKLADRHYPELSVSERLRFALGAYNAGPGHIRDGREIARRQGLDPDVWFDNVERALPLLARREYAGKARYGFCRCAEAVRYVSEIHQRYRRYVEVTR